VPLGLFPLFPGKQADAQEVVENSYHRQGRYCPWLARWSQAVGDFGLTVVSEPTSSNSKASASVTACRNSAAFWGCSSVGHTLGVCALVGAVILTRDHGRVVDVAAFGLLLGLLWVSSNASATSPPPPLYPTPKAGLNTYC
jgi:hypothetical protein